MITAASPKSLKDPEFRRNRKVLLRLTALNIIIYLALLIPLAGLSKNATILDKFRDINDKIYREYNIIDAAVYSVPILAFYNIIEISLFFGYQMFNRPCTLTLRIGFLLHDFAYFITYFITTEWKSVGCEWKDDYCELAASGLYSTASCVLFLFTFLIGFVILVTYSKLPKYGCSCCDPPVIMMNGQMVQLQTAATQGKNQQLNFVLNPNQANDQTSPFLLTQQSQVTNQPVVMRPTVLPVTVPQSNDQPPPYDFCIAGQP